jgi:ASC-1-like (ASCH) protein
MQKVDTTENRKVRYKNNPYNMCLPEIDPLCHDFRDIIALHIQIFGNVDVFSETSLEFKAIHENENFGELPKYKYREYPEGTKFKKVKQEYIPVVKAKKRTAQYRPASELHSELRFGDLIIYNHTVYGVIEVRKHGVLVKQDHISRVMMIEWSYVNALPISAYWLARFSFFKKDFELEIDYERVYFASRELWKGYWLHIGLNIGYVVIQDTVVYRQVRYMHEVQDIIYAFTGQYGQKTPLPSSFIRQTSFSDYFKAAYEEGFFPPRHKILPEMFDNVRPNIHEYNNGYRSRRFAKIDFVTQDGVETGRTTRLGRKLSIQDKKFMEDNPELFQKD